MSPRKTNAVKEVANRLTEVFRALKTKAQLMEEIVVTFKKLVTDGRSLMLDSFLFLSHADSLLRCWPCFLAARRDPIFSLDFISTSVCFFTFSYFQESA